jgi:hypothetical protein
VRRGADRSLTSTSPRLGGYSRRALRSGWTGSEEVGQQLARDEGHHEQCHEECREVGRDWYDGHNGNRHNQHGSGPPSRDIHRLDRDSRPAGQRAYHWRVIRATPATAEGKATEELAIKLHVASVGVADPSQAQDDSPVLESSADKPLSAQVAVGLDKASCPSLPLGTRPLRFPGILRLFGRVPYGDPRLTGWYAQPLAVGWSTSAARRQLDTYTSSTSAQADTRRPAST